MLHFGDCMVLTGNSRCVCELAIWCCGASLNDVGPCKGTCEPQEIGKGIAKSSTLRGVPWESQDSVGAWTFEPRKTSTTTIHASDPIKCRDESKRDKARQTSGEVAARPIGPDLTLPRQLRFPSLPLALARSPVPCSERSPLSALFRDHTDQQKVNPPDTSWT